MWDELVKLLLSDKLFKVKDEVEPLLVRDAREGIIRVLSLQVSNELSELVVDTISLYGVCQRFPPYDGGEVTIWFPVAGFIYMLAVIE